MSEPTWKKFLSDAGKPIGITGSWILAISFVLFLIVLTVRACAAPESEQAWVTACALAEGKEHKMGAERFCVKFEMVDNYPVYDFNEWKQGCVNLGGEAATRNGVTACRNIEVIQELGAKEDYTGGN